MEQHLTQGDTREDFTALLCQIMHKIHNNNNNNSKQKQKKKRVFCKNVYPLSDGQPSFLFLHI